MVTHPLTAAQSTLLRGLLQQREAVLQRINDSCHAILLGTYSVAQITGQPLNITDAGIEFTPTE